MSGVRLQQERNSMYQFFVEENQINDKSVIIVGPDVNHIKNVLRMKTGEELSVSNGKDSKEIRCAITSVNDDNIECEIRFVKEDNHELPGKIYLFQGLPKADKMESIIQKNIELGVFSIVPVAMKRSVVKLDEKKAEAKIARWQSIAQAAAKQSKRGIIPQITPLMSFKQAVEYAKENCDIKILPYEMAEDMTHTREIFAGLKPGQSVAVFIGPEGGFDPSEIDIAVEAGFLPVTLGKRILRTETAGMCVMSILMYLSEDR